MVMSTRWWATALVFSSVTSGIRTSLVDGSTSGQESLRDLVREPDFETFELARLWVAERQATRVLVDPDPDSPNLAQMGDEAAVGLERREACRLQMSRLARFHVLDGTVVVVLAGVEGDAASSGSRSRLSIASDAPSDELHRRVRATP